MNIGHISIFGLIGNAYNDKGEITEKGVELLDVIEQVQSVGEVDAIHVHINSQGGFVSVGKAIAEFLSDIPNCFTIAEELCASIATEIHLSVPLQNRFIQSNCQYMIHNPFIPAEASKGGDAAALQKVANEMKEVEDQLEKMYSKATGLNKKVISGLMAQETFLTPEQCLKLNFASKITEKETAQAVALLYTDKTNKMKKPLMNRIALAMSILKGEETPEALAKAEALALAIENRQAKAVMITAGDETLETPFMDVAVGDAVTINGEPAADGTYEMTEGEISLFMGETETAGVGTMIVVVDGLISEITAPVIDAENKDEELATLKAELEAEKAKNEVLTTEVSEANATAEEAVSTLEGLAKLGSTFTPPAAQASFKKKETKDSSLMTKEVMSARREEYKKK